MPDIETVYVKLNETTLIGDTSYDAGAVVAVDPAQAQALVQSGAAEIVKPGDIPTLGGPGGPGRPSIIEEATAPKPPDKGVHPRQR